MPLLDHDVRYIITAGIVNLKYFLAKLRRSPRIN